MGVRVVRRQSIDGGKTLSQIFQEEESRRNPARGQGFIVSRNQLLAAIEEALIKCGAGYENRSNYLLAIEADLNGAWQKAFNLPKG